MHPGPTVIPTRRHRDRIVGGRCPIRATRNIIIALVGSSNNLQAFAPLRLTASIESMIATRHPPRGLHHERRQFMDLIDFDRICYRRSVNNDESDAPLKTRQVPASSASIFISGFPYQIMPRTARLLTKATRPLIWPYSPYQCQLAP